MPVQLTLRSPKGGRVLHESTYADGYRIDAVSGWLIVVDRNGSTVAAHAACPGLEGAVVEYASAGVRAAEVGEEGEGEVEYPDGTRSAVLDTPPLRVADVRDDGDRFTEHLIEQLRRLGDEYGPLGVAIAAASLTDPRVLVAQIDPDAPEPARPIEADAEDPVDHTHDGCEANLDALRAEVRRLSGLLDDASVEAERADTAEAELATYRREVDEQTARAEREHAARLRLEREVESMTGKRNRAREHAVRNERERDDAEQRLRDTVPEPWLRPVADDPRRPHPGEWPDDAVLLRYVELRRLVSLHLERYADANVARAMLEGDVPLRLSEVLDR